jgi:hypothetical protein
VSLSTSIGHNIESSTPSHHGTSSPLVALYTIIKASATSQALVGSYFLGEKEKKQK